MAHFDQQSSASPITSAHEVTSEGAVDTSSGATRDTPPSLITASVGANSGTGHDRNLSADSVAPAARSGASASSDASSLPHVVVPHPKKFSAVNISKKFLEKNSGPTQTPSVTPSSVTAKTNGAPSRPYVQVPSSSHSRLVTAKLTATPPISSGSGQGWSRPSSVAPTAPSPSGSSVGGISSNSALPNHSTPQLPHAGKVIQPQPRSNVSPIREHASSKPAWRNQMSATGTAGRDAVLRNDFPTAAEVAQENVRKAKLSSKEPPLPTPDEQARMVDADTFRGVHLDPNAHHWDEMEGDDDDFLDGVIEFGDGRQYKVEAPKPFTAPEDGLVASLGESSIPVSKEERFQDDFDRSWPRTRTSPSTSASPINHISGLTPTSPRSQHLLPDGSKVLFNERSNKLEPYNSTRPAPRRIGQPGGDPRLGHADTSQSNFRTPKHLPMHDLPSKSRAPGTDHAPGHDRHRDFPRTDTTSQRTVSSESKHATSSARDDEALSTSSLAQSFRRTPRDGHRQLPPHLAQALPPPPPASSSSRRLSHNRSQLPHSTWGDVTQSSIAPQRSPVLSQISADLSPSIERSSQVSLPASGELEDVRKDVMVSAAARAKIRRQQEEEEREREKERARKKAAELEEKLKPKTYELQPQLTMEQQAVAFIQESIGSLSVKEEIKLSPSASVPNGLPPITSRRPPSLRGTTGQPSDAHRSPDFRRTSFSSSTSATDADSWRTKAGPLPPIASQSPRPKSPSRPLLGSSPSVMEQAAAAANKSEELEVIDFSDLGQFVCGDKQLPPSHSSKPRRATAGEFFEDDPPPEIEGCSNQDARSQEPVHAENFDTLSQHNLGPAPSAKTHMSSHSIDSNSSFYAGHLSRAQRGPFREPAISTLDDVMSRIKGALDVMQAGEVPKESVQSKQPSELDVAPAATHLSPAYVLAAIKPVAPRQRWLPPALRSFNDGNLDREGFLLSSDEPPWSPKAHSGVVVRLPIISRHTEPLSKRQETLSKTPPFPPRWDILTWDPPVEGMNRRDLSVNGVLFRKQPVFKGNSKYPVVLPRSKNRSNFTTIRSPLSEVPSASIPKLGGVGAFGKQRGVDQLTSWRKPASTETPPQSAVPLSPQEPLSAVTSTIADKDVIPSSPEPSTSGSVRLKSQPKMPAGSSVAIRRDSRIDAVDANATSLVTFIVNSELDAPARLGKLPEKMLEPHREPVPSSLCQLSDFEPHPTSKVASNMTTKAASPSVPSFFSELKSQASSPVITVTSLRESRVDSVNSEDSQIPMTPSTRWAKSPLTFPLKDSQTRSAVPDQIKAAWTQTPEKPHLPSVNSLEGLADDLIPFTLHEVKSEDGQTPPPTAPVGPSRMAFDVSRAFQQVPEPPSPAVPAALPHAPTPLAPQHATPHRGLSFMGSPNGAVRPNYPSYHTPLVSHSPSPGIAAYPHASPVPSRLNLQPVYGQPMWMSMPPPSSNQNGAPTMMRPLSTQYPSQMMTYPSAPQPMYSQPANMAASLAQQSMSNGSHLGQHLGPGRGRGGGMMMTGSPALAQAMPQHLVQQASHHGVSGVPPMYTGSPVLMHSPMMQMQVPANHSYMPAGQNHMRMNGMLPPPPPNALPPGSQRPMQHGGHMPPPQLPPHLNYAPMPSSWRA